MPEDPQQPEANNWIAILLNGKSKRISVLNPQFDKGRLVRIEGLRPFERLDVEGNPVEPTVDDANTLKRSIYAEFFKKPFKNLLVLSGAGSSMDVGGLSMYQLWDKVEKLYNEGDIDRFKAIRLAVNFDVDKKDLEALLSQIEGYRKFAGDKEVKAVDKNYKLSEIRDTIFGVIKTHCTIPKPSGNFPHKVFLEKLLQRKQTSPRIKIFTLNYDLLFEYASTEVNAVVIDGFSFTYPRTFSGRFFDYDIVQREGSKLQEEDNFIQRVYHLHKLHGSLNWERNSTNDKILISDEPKKPLMVYPREAKYEDSYEQPFFEMMARFQRSLRINNDTLLVCIGYSFNDKHINAAIEEALNQNPSFRLAVINPNFDSAHTSESIKRIREVAEGSEKILMISETFTDFANYYPETKTYENENYIAINLQNDQQKN